MNEGPLYPGHSILTPSDVYHGTMEGSDIYVHNQGQDVLLVFGTNETAWDTWSPGGSWSGDKATPAAVRLHAQALYQLHQ